MSAPLPSGTGALVATEDRKIRGDLGIDGKSKIVAVACEGATDLEIFHQLVNGGPA